MRAFAKVVATLQQQENQAFQALHAQMHSAPAAAIPIIACPQTQTHVSCNPREWKPQKVSSSGMRAFAQVVDTMKEQQHQVVQALSMHLWYAGSSIYPVALPLACTLAAAGCYARVSEEASSFQCSKGIAGGRIAEPSHCRERRDWVRKDDSVASIFARASGGIMRAESDVDVRTRKICRGQSGTGRRIQW